MSFLRTTQFLLYGGARFGHAGYEARKNVAPLATDMAGRIALVTGGNAGIGFEVCQQLLLMGADVYVLARRNDEEAMAKLAALPKGRATLVLCDVSSRASVAECVAFCQRTLPRIDALVLNAGVMLAEPKTSVDGLELTLATNVVSNVFMIDALMPLLQGEEDGALLLSQLMWVASASADARVVLVSSGGGITETLRTSDDEYAQGKYDGTTAYARTKRMQIALAHHYARTTAGSVHFYAMHPGWSSTPGVQSAMPGFFGMMGSRFRTAAQGADTISWLASVQPRAEPNGGFFRDREVELEHFTLGFTSYPVELEAQLYAWLKSKWDPNSLTEANISNLKL